MEFYTVTYELHFRREGFKLRALNQGMRELNDDNKRVNILDDDGNTVNTPVPLDDDGKALDPDGEEVYLDFDVYEEMAFSTFDV